MSYIPNWISSLGVDEIDLPSTIVTHTQKKKKKKQVKQEKKKNTKKVILKDWIFYTFGFTISYQMNYTISNEEKQ